MDTLEKAMNALLNHLNKNLFGANPEVSDIKVRNTHSDYAVTSDTTKQNHRKNLLHYMGSNIWEGNLSELRAMR